MGDALPAKVFGALGDPVRRGILELLAEGEKAAGTIVTEVRAYTSISQPAVSQHLKVLRDVGLLTVRNEGTRRIYTIDAEGLDAARRWLDRLVHPLEPFHQPLNALATEVARGKRSRRKHAGHGGTDTTSDRIPM